MEASLVSGEAKHTLETVRVLHETVLALRTALEGSRKELSELRNRFRDGSGDGNDGVKEPGPMETGDETKTGSREEDDDDVFADGKQDSGTDSEDIDDIELVFTTEETDPSAIQEDMVPIREERRPEMHTVIVETDISKCGVIDEREGLPASRRNTLPDPLPYRPIVHRDILAAARAGKGSPRKVGPTPGTSARQETGAQTDITAVPAQWKSETYLAHKITNNLTTLPSKFTLPVPRAPHLTVSDKSREARRVLLSDINFTSMVPELSRSADHLHQEEELVRGRMDCTKPCEAWRSKLPEAGRHGSRSSWGSHCQASASSIVAEEPQRRHSWRSPPAACCQPRHSWSSVPPLRCHPVRHACRCEESPTGRRDRIVVHHCCPAGQSLPDLRGDGDSGDSTDSLIDEAEEFLRWSIDMLLAKTKRNERRHSESDSVAGFKPHKAAQPFLPKMPNDLKEDYLVKVITAEGRIVTGRVRYSGEVAGKAEPHVGIELHTNGGGSDGTFLGHRYFDCKPNHAIFVPFKKVVLAWCT